MSFCGMTVKKTHRVIFMEASAAILILLLFLEISRC